MKSAFCLLLLAGLFSAGSVAAKEVVRVPAPAGVLPVIVTEPLAMTGNAYTAYDRLALALERASAARKWPLKVAVEKVASNAPDYQTELLITIQRVREEVPGEYIYRGWTTLWVDGKKHDLGIVTFSYYYRLSEQVDDRLEKVFRGAAEVTADKVEPLLFPDLKKEKK